MLTTLYADRLAAEGILSTRGASGSDRDRYDEHGDREI